MKKTLSLILALLMSVSCASFAFAAEEDEVLLNDVAIAEEAEEEAVEVEEPSLYDEAIEFLGAYGIYKGYGDSKMGANDDIQRYQMALFTSRIATGWVDDAAWNTGIWNASYTEFTDVNEAPAANYLGAISYANQNGIIEGYGDGRFGPTDGITYQNALTMVVRALGFQNLSWPWGYIEKAVNLGLTKGIVDVAYTDVLTRGEVAQVIYNALFAETKDGTTLGAKNFGIEFGWETIIITATDGAFFATDGEKAKDGIVAYKIVESDGSLGEDTYYTKAATFGFEGHEDELAVGKAFKVCFNKDGILFAKSLYVETLWNYGPETTEVKDYFAGKTAVSKYTEATYIDKAGKIAYKDEVIVAEAFGATKVTKETKHELIAIDWDNGNILTAITDKDGKITGYEVAWYYNALLDQYYNFKTKATGTDKLDGDIEIIGYDILDEKDVEELLKGLVVETASAVDAFNVLTANPAYSAYASLELFDLNGNDYGVYTSYRLGKIAQDKKNCGHADNQHVVISDLSNDMAGKIFAAINDKDYASRAFNKVLAGECEKCKNNEVWWTDDYAPETDEDGKIETNYVIYNFNKATNELRVLETLEAETGVLRAFNVGKQIINIDGTTYSFKYDGFEGDLFASTDDMNKSYVTKAITTAYLKNLFNQFVEFVVVDDAIVYVRAKSAGEKNYLVVESYAGVSSDGYIVVNAYSTKDLKLGQYRIGSYNGWEKGDYFYNLDDATAKESFSKGVIYNVTSCDKENDVYFVELVGEFDKDGKYEVTDLAKKEITDFDIDEDGYVVIKLKGDTDATEFKSSSEDTWIILGNKDDNYVPMAVYTGKLYHDDVAANEWDVDGDFIKLGDHLFLVVNATNVVGFDYDEYGAGFVVYMKKLTTSATYDVYGNEDADWYLLGASTYDVLVFDLLKGEEKAVTAQNVKLVPGYTYITLDGKIVDDDKFNFGGAWAAMVAQYADTAHDSADYLFKSNVAFKSAWITKDGFDKKAFAKDHLDFLGLKNYHKNEIAGKVIALDVDKNGLVTGYTDVTKNTAKFWTADKNATNTYNCSYVYDVKNNSVVIYVWVGSVAKAASVDASSKWAIEVGTDAYITAEADIATKTVDGVLTSATIGSVTFEYVGDATKDTHWNVGLNGYTFGLAGECTKEAWNTVVDGKNVYGTLVEALYAPHAEDDVDCDMIQAVTVDFDDAKVEQDKWTTIEATFSGYKGGTYVEYVFTVCAIIEKNADGVYELTFSIDKNATNSEASVAFTNYVELD